MFFNTQSYNSFVEKNANFLSGIFKVIRIHTMNANTMNFIVILPIGTMNFIVILLMGKDLIVRVKEKNVPS